jgi:hypothetical protein
MIGLVKMNCSGEALRIKSQKPFNPAAHCGFYGQVGRGDFAAGIWKVVGQ